MADQAKATGNGARVRKRARLTVAEVLRGVRDELRELTGKRVEAATTVEPGDDGGWRVVLEVLELERVPDSTDLLGSYELEVDADGRLVGWRRLRRYARGEQGDDG